MLILIHELSWFSSAPIDLFLLFSQAKENLGAQGWSLTAAEVEALEIAAKKVPKQLIQNSFQTA